MFTRVKESRNGEYLQVVENYREDGKVKQRLVKYVGHYESIDHALDQMRRELPLARRRAAAAERSPWQAQRGRALREEANHLAAKLEGLRRFADEHPDVVERDRARAERHASQQLEARKKRREA